MTTIAAVYARQSLDVTEGIDRQLERCRRLIEARGWTVGPEYQDNDTSAAKQRGPGTAWYSMLEDLTAKKADVVVAVDLDRLLRSTRDLIAITDTGARVLTVDGEIDLTTADGEFRATMLAGIARFEVRRKGERQKRANEARAAKGIPGPGRRRYGYESDGITPREAEAQHVRRAFQHVADGGSLRSLLLWFLDNKIDPAPGKLWDQRRLRDMLLNPWYSGSMIHRGKVIPSEVIVPIVAPELAEEVRAILSDPSRTTSPGPAPRHLLSHLLYCGECGSPMYYMRGYMCKVAPNHVHIAKHIIEPFIVDQVALAFASSGSSIAPASPGALNLSALVDAHARNAEAVTAVLADRDEGLVPASVARTRLLELKTAREKIEADLERARSEKSASSVLATVAEELLVGTSASMAEFSSAKRTIAERFLALDLDRQRSVIGSLMYIEVTKPQGGTPAERAPQRRVIVSHTTATKLNPETPPETYDD
ncbi:recombinase family protein [Glutamicibacter soli]|nr:recombinase family protein [Glutamicibacter soli]